MAYEYIRRIKKSNRTLYRCKDTFGNLKDLSSKQIKQLISCGNTFSGIAIAKDGRIYTTRIKNSSQIYHGISGYSILTGASLTALSNKYEPFKERNVVTVIYDYLCAPFNALSSICIIHGIRRTGKTVALFHSINKLLKNGINSNEIAYILVNTENASFDNLEYIISNTQCKYLFIDEITRVKDFISRASVISDIYSLDKKIVITGTDSFVFPHALATTLFMRAKLCRTTAIGYSEYLRIMNKNASLAEADNFLIHGGVLVPTEFSEIDSAKDALEAVTFYNIRNSIYKNKSTDFRVDNDVLQLKEDQFVYLVYNIIQISTEPRKASDLGRNLLLLGKDSKAYIHQYGGVSISAFNRLNNIKIETISTVYRALSDLDIVKQITNCADDDAIIGIERITDIEPITMIQSLLYTIKYHKKSPNNLGLLFENFVISQVMAYKLNGHKLEINYCKYKHNGVEHEIDLVVTNNHKAIAIEIKYDTIAKKEYTKHLTDLTIDKVIPNITKKLVVYRGETLNIYGIQFVNINDFSLNLDFYLK